MALSHFIPSYADVRGLLGVNVDELPDDAIELKVHERSVQLSLRGIAANLESSYLAARAEASPSALQQELVVAVQVFAAWHVAADLIVSAPHFAPRLITDGKASVQRQTVGYEELIARLQGGRDRNMKHLKLAWASLQAGQPLDSAEVELLTGLRISTPAFDPVTGV